MDPYDSAAVQAVWQRVLQPPQTSPDEETLLEWLAGEKGSYRYYQAMARRSARHRRQFLAMAGDEARHAARLAALYFLCFGRKPQVLSAAAETERSFGAALRAGYEAERGASRGYREAASRWPEHRTLLNELADDEARHARTLHDITAAFLHA